MREAGKDPVIAGDGFGRLGFAALGTHWEIEVGFEQGGGGWKVARIVDIDCLRADARGPVRHMFGPEGLTRVAHAVARVRALADTPEAWEHASALFAILRSPATELASAACQAIACRLRAIEAQRERRELAGEAQP